MAKRLTDEERGFRQGAAIALAVLARQHDQPAMAADILLQLGLTMAKLRSAGVDAYDLQPLRREVEKQSS